ncbi:hypothetical protein P3748_16930 [Vibrio parahaemolyticus]|nr:hypothetical protein [Vibrio parahaemolyticus]MDF5038162.1 hypothetical protein [Vibrio parahaemolyticus]MDF5686906.1 hypothetical protein [Vibrio parahaemolyticus]
MFEKLMVVALGGLFGFSLTLLKENRAAKKSRHVETNYLAIIVTSKLEKFISDCRIVVTDRGYTDAEGERYSGVSIPSFSPLELEVEWKVLEQDLLYDILSLPQLIHQVESYISSVGEHAFPPDYDEYYTARTSKFASLGLIAIQLSEQLRTIGKLPMRKIEDWDDKTTFIHHLQESEEIELNRFASRAHFFESQKTN